MFDHDVHPLREFNIGSATDSGAWPPWFDAARTATTQALEDWFGSESASARTAVVAVVGPNVHLSGVVGGNVRDQTDAGVLLWSLSKTALAAAVFRLVELGELGLNARVVDLLPDAPCDPAATVGQLLNHTAGVPDYGSWPDYHEAVRERPDAPWPLDTYLERARSVGSVGPPGGQWAYSNIGYLMVRQIIETVSGLPVSEALCRLVFAPLGLARTSVALTPGDVGHLMFDAATGSLAYHPGWVAHGVVRSTIEETVLLFDGILGGRLVSSESLASMTEPVIHIADRTSLGRLAWGHGVLLGTGLPFGDVTGHTGAGPGSTTAALRIISPFGNAITVATAIDDEREHGAAELAIRVAAVVLDECESIHRNE